MEKVVVVAAVGNQVEEAHLVVALAQRGPCLLEEAARKVHLPMETVVVLSLLFLLASLLGETRVEAPEVRLLAPGM